MGFAVKDTGQPAADPIKLARLKQLFQRRAELTPEQQARLDEEMKIAGIPADVVKPPSAGQVLYEDYVEPIASGLKSFTKENALPMAGQLGGMAIGSRLGAPLAGGAMGAAAGTYLNYMTGLAKPPEESLTGLPPEAEGPLATGLLSYGMGRLTKPALTNLPGTQAGKQEMGSLQLRKLGDSLQTPSPAPSSGMYDAIAAGQNPKVGMQPFLDTLKDLRKEFGGLARNQKLGPSVPGKATDTSSGIMGKIKQYQDNLGYYGKGWPLDKLRSEMKALNADIGAAEASGGAELGALRSMKRAMWDSLEKSGADSAPLRAANKQFMKELASDELADILRKKGLSFKQTHGVLLPETNPSAVKNALKNLPGDSLITKSLSAQMPKIEAFLDDLAKIPKLEAEGGISTKLGSPGRWVAGLGASAVGSLAGGGMAGAAAGAAGGIATYEAVAKLMMSEKGRQFTIGLLKSTGGHWTEAVSQLLVNAASQQFFNRSDDEE